MIVTAKSVQEASETLARQGKPATAANLRAVLGGGSYRTIYKYMPKAADKVEKVENTERVGKVVEVAEIPADPHDLKEWLGDQAKSIKCVVVDSDHYDDLFESKGMLSDTLYELKKLQMKSQAVKDSVAIDEVELAELRRSAGVVVGLRQRVKGQDAELDKLIAVTEILNRSDPADVLLIEARRVIEG